MCFFSPLDLHSFLCNLPETLPRYVPESSHLLEEAEVPGSRARFLQGRFPIYLCSFGSISLCQDALEALLASVSLFLSGSPSCKEHPGPAQPSQLGGH